MSIHPTAIVSPSAELGDDVSVGPYAIIEAESSLGSGCIVEAHAQIRRGSRLGPGCFVGSGAIIGSDPQYHGFDSRMPSGVTVGSQCILREYVTVHRSIHESGATRLGDKNFLMAGAHVGHDAQVGDKNTMANNVLLAGHVQLGSHCFLGGGSVYHQYVRIGDFVMTQGNSGFSLDLPPFVLASDVNIVNGINLVGLRRSGFSPDERSRIKRAFREVYFGKKTLESILTEWAARELSVAEKNFYDFLSSPSKKGLCRRSSQSAGID